MQAMTHTRTVSPDDRLKLLPFMPSVSSEPLGWGGVRVEHFRHQPDNEVALPPLAHLFLVLRSEGVTHARIEVDGESF